MAETEEAGFNLLLSALREAHATSPDIRVGQLIYNALVSPTNWPPCPSIYYAEDGALAERIRAFVRGEEPRR